jgi:hypothetical protein
MVHWYSRWTSFGGLGFVGVSPLERGDASTVRPHSVNPGLPRDSLNVEIEPRSTLDVQRRPPRLGGSEQIEELDF